MDYKHALNNAIDWIAENCPSDTKFAKALYEISSDSDFVFENLNYYYEADEVLEIMDDAEIRLPEKYIEEKPFISWEQQCRELGINPREFY